MGRTGETYRPTKERCWHSSVRLDEDLIYMRTAKVAVELATDISPVIVWIEPGVNLWQERRDDEIDAGTKVGPQIEVYKIAWIVGPSFGMLRNRSDHMKDSRTRDTSKGVKVYIAAAGAKVSSYNKQLCSTAKHIGRKL